MLCSQRPSVLLDNFPLPRVREARTCALSTFRCRARVHAAAISHGRSRRRRKLPTGHDPRLGTGTKGRRHNASVSSVRSGAVPPNAQPGSGDHTVGRHERALRDANAERLGRFQIDYECIARGMLDRQIAGSRATQNPRHGRPHRACTARQSRSSRSATPRLRQTAARRRSLAVDASRSARKCAGIGEGKA